MSFININSETIVKRKQPLPIHPKMYSAFSIKSRNSKAKQTQSLFFHKQKSKHRKMPEDLHCIDLQTVNKNVVNKVSKYKEHCEEETTRLHKELNEKIEQLSSSYPISSLNKKYMGQMESMKNQIDAQKYELDRKERDCQDEVKKLSRALKNVQNKYTMLQIKHQNMAKKAFQYQSK